MTDLMEKIIFPLKIPVRSQYRKYLLRDIDQNFKFVLIHSKLEDRASTLMTLVSFHIGQLNLTFKA